MSSSYIKQCAPASSPEKERKSRDTSPHDGYTVCTISPARIVSGSGVRRRDVSLSFLKSVGVDVAEDANGGLLFIERVGR